MLPALCKYKSMSELSHTFTHVITVSILFVKATNFKNYITEENTFELDD